MEHEASLTVEVDAPGQAREIGSSKGTESDEHCKQKELCQKS